MPAIEIIGGIVTAPSTTETALTVNSGNSFTVRAAPPDAKIYLIAAWALSQTAGFFAIRSPMMHDNVKGIRFKTVAAKCWALMKAKLLQPLFAQDSLVVTLSGSATGGDIEQGFIMNYYDTLPGADANLRTWNDIKDKLGDVLTVPVTCATGTAGGWSGAVALNSTNDLMKANTNYALIGYVTTVAGGAMRIYGTDTSGLGIGGPLDVDDWENTSEWFRDLSESSGLPCIPVINSANKANTYVDVSVDENGANPIIDLIFVELLS